MTYIQTHSGNCFRLDQPTALTATQDDICTALSRIPRFNGHTKKVYTVAQHSVAAYRIANAWRLNPELCAAALLHDAHEAYIGDVPTPVKSFLTGIKELAYSVDRAIGESFDVLPAHMRDPRIRAIDAALLIMEADALLAGGRVGSFAAMRLPDVPFFALRNVRRGLEGKAPCWGEAKARREMMRCIDEAMDNVTVWRSNSNIYERNSRHLNDGAEIFRVPMLSPLPVFEEAAPPF